ncbi:TPA: hypothetical protein SG801_001338 [Campylobacter coli]|nr:hypothetical protein [Campylobacter coli]
MNLENSLQADIDSNIYYKELCDRLLIENKELKSENTNLKAIDLCNNAISNNFLSRKLI